MVKDTVKYFKYFKRQFFQKKKLNFLILYATSKCNFKCKTCFFHKRLNKEDDLSFEEYEKISKNLGDISILLISGGEPFLNPRLRDICSLFIRNNKINTLYIPTNGFYTEKILSVAESLLKEFPQIILSINPSLDGLLDYHEQLRGVKDSFQNAMKTTHGLALLKRKYKNLQIIANSVICEDNLENIKKLALFLKKSEIDHQAFEIMRGDNRDKSLSKAGLAKIKEIHKFILENRLYHLDKDVNGDFVSKFINKIAILGHLKYTQSLKERVLNNEKWPVRCAAGSSIAVIYPNGETGICELLGTVGNIRENDYNLNKLLASPAAMKKKGEIKKNKCSCTHICFINASIARDLKTIFKLPYFYLKSLL